MAIGPKGSSTKPLSQQSHHESLEVNDSFCQVETSSDEDDEDETDLAILSPEDLNEKKRRNAHKEYKLFGPDRQQKVG